MVPRDGIEPPTRGFSILCSKTLNFINELIGLEFLRNLQPPTKWIIFSALNIQDELAELAYGMAVYGNSDNRVNGYC